MMQATLVSQSGSTSPCNAEMNLIYASKHLYHQKRILSSTKHFQQTKILLWLRTHIKLWTSIASMQTNKTSLLVSKHHQLLQVIIPFLLRFQLITFAPTILTKRNYSTTMQFISIELYTTMNQSIWRLSMTTIPYKKVIMVKLSIIGTTESSKITPGKENF